MKKRKENDLSSILNRSLSGMAYHSRAKQVLQAVKQVLKGKKYELIQIDAKTWKEVEVKPKTKRNNGKSN